YNVHHFVGMIQRMGVRAPILLIGGIVITLFMDSFLALGMIACYRSFSLSYISFREKVFHFILRYSSRLIK
ncbi:MAG: ABC transporter ATP-binding protein, partial [Clostridia bacterium]|nr:ABC transporter ATP-binding protein [Clostridia bacterium]